MGATKLILRKLATLEHNLKTDEQLLTNKITKRLAERGALNAEISRYNRQIRLLAAYRETTAACAAMQQMSAMAEDKVERGSAHIAQMLDQRQIIQQRAKLLARLITYAAKRKEQSQYKWSLGFFCIKFNFGFSKKQKFAAVDAMRNYLMTGDSKDLTEHLPALKNGELGKICKDWLAQ